MFNFLVGTFYRSIGKDKSILFEALLFCEGYPDDFLYGVGEEDDV